MRLIDADRAKKDFNLNFGGVSHAVIANRILDEQPTIDAVEVVRGHNVGDFCIYSFGNENKSLAIVEIVKILNDERGVAEVKFHKVIVDDTGNDFFAYLHKTGQTMNASFCYLKNITPSGERRSDG